MPLWVGLGSIEGIQYSIVIEILDVVVLNVYYFSRINASSKVPIHSIIGRRRLDTWLNKIIPAAK